MTNPWEENWAKPAAPEDQGPWSDYGTPAKPPEEGSDTARGFKVALGQTIPLVKGAIGLVGATAEKTFGEGGVSTAVKDWGLHGYNEGMAKLQPLAKDTDELTTSWDRAKSGDIGALIDWAQYGLGYSAGQMAQAAATGVVGGAVGTAVAGPGTGTVPGAVAGVIEGGAVRAAAQRVIGGLVAKEAAKMAEQQLAKEGVVATAEAVAARAAAPELQRAATAAAAKSIGQTSGLMGYAGAQEAGSIYPEAEAQAAKEGRELGGADLARVWATSIGAAALEGATDKMGLDALTGKVKLGGSGGTVSRALTGAAVAAGGEAATEAVQTGLERLGAGQNLTDAEAVKDYINSAGLGAIGGGPVGALSGALHPVKIAERVPSADDIANAPNLDDAIEAATATAGSMDEILDRHVTNQTNATNAYLGTPEGQAEAATHAAEDLAPDERAKGAQLAPAMDRQADLTAQMNAQPTALDRQLTQDQATTALQLASPPTQRAQTTLTDDTPFDSERAAKQRAAVLRYESASVKKDGATYDIVPHPTAPGQFAIQRTAPVVEEAPALTPQEPLASVQNRIEASALVGDKKNRLAPDAGRQVIVTAAMKRVEERGGVASPQEARIFHEAGIGKPYDRIDESLATPLTTGQKLTQATGLAMPENPPRFSVRPAEVAAESAGQAAEQRARTDSAFNTLSRKNNEAKIALDQKNAATVAKTQQQAKPAAADVLAIAKIEPSHRTAEQAMTLDTARRAYSADEMRVLETAATAPYKLTSTERLTLASLRGTKLSAKRDSTLQSYAKQSGVDVLPSDIAALPKQSAAEKGQLSSQMYASVKNLARVFGKQLVVFDSKDPRAADGFISSSDSSTIYLNSRSEIPHLVVFGHELMHALKQDNSAAYEAVKEAIKLKADANTDVAGVRGDMEELTSDLLGNRFREPEFWADVFRQVTEGKSEAEGRQVTMKLAASVMRVVNATMKALGGKGFNTDDMVENLGEVKTALKKALADYAAERKTAAVALDRSQFSNQENTSKVTSAAQSTPSEKPTQTSDTKRVEATKRARQEMGYKNSEKRGWFSGAPAGLTQLKPESAREGNLYGPGVYLARDREFADTYGRGEGRTVYNAEHEVKNAFDTGAVQSRIAAEQLLTDLGVAKSALRAALGDRPRVANDTIYKVLAAQLGSKRAANEALAKAGYDTILFKTGRGEELAVALVPVKLNGEAVAASPKAAPVPKKSEPFELSLVAKTSAKREAPISDKAATQEDFQPGRIGGLLEKDNWAFMTAENPRGEQASAEYNKAAQAKLKADLDEIGAQYRDVLGKYGQEENSLAVTGITEEQATKLGKKYDQDSVLTNKGLIYQDGSINPATGITTFKDAPEDYFSKVGNTTFRVDIDFENKLNEQPVKLSGKREQLDPDVVAALGRHIRNLTPAERAKMRVGTAQRLVDQIESLPSAKEMAAVAYAGRAKRGWYEHSARALEHVFGGDAPRFAALLAALSPQVSVQSNLYNALSTWKNWIADGRPTTREEIIDTLSKSVQGGKGRGSVLDAWINNSVRALSSEDPAGLVLSGPKVNSFMKNLIGHTEEVTNDAWMSNYALVNQTMFSGSLNVSGTDPGKGTGYLAMSARVREAAKELTKLTGEEWTPAEVQETIWSWAKTIYEKQDSAGEERGAKQLVLDKAITAEMINATPDFRTLFHDDVNEKLLSDAGYGEQLSSLRGRRDLGSASQQEPSAESEAAPFAPETQQRYELRAAARLEELHQRSRGVKASEKRTTDTPAFKKWFGDSKVVDAEGKPLVVYHGTTSSFDSFDPKMVGATFGHDKAGFFFTNSQEDASFYALPSEDGGSGGNVMSVYLRIERPLTLDKFLGESGLNIDDEYEREGHERLIDFYDFTRPEIEEELARSDYDGLIFEREGEMLLVAKKPDQIKSAIGNSGAFDETNPSILASEKRSVFEGYSPEQASAAQKVFAQPKDLTVRERWDALKDNFAVRAKQALVDQFAPIAKLDQKAYMQARMSKASESTLEATLLYGKPYMHDGLPDVNVKDKGFAQVLADLKGEHDRFLQWVAAQRAERLKTLGLENLFGDGDIAALKTLNQGKMEDGSSRPEAYAKALVQLNDFNDAVLKVAEESGLIDAEARTLFKDVPYVPFYRVMSGDQMTGPKFSSGLVNQYAFKKLKGGDKQLNGDLLANTLLNWSHLFQAAAKNRAAAATIEAAKAADIAYEVPAGTKGAVKVLENGNTVHYAVEDPYLLDAITAVSYTAPEWVKPLSTVKRWLTTTVTANPAFKIRNLIRDSVSAVAQSDLDTNIAKNLKAGWAATNKGNQTYASMMASGGLMRFGSSVEGDSAARAHDIVRKLGGEVLDENGSKALWTKVRDTFDAYQELGDRTEQVNRAALYEQLRKKGYDHADASFMARDLLDFSMSGSAPIVRFLTQTVPFLNARMQGLYKLGRAASENPQRFWAVTGAVAGASLALYAAYHDDKDWKKREDWERDAYWWFKIGDKALRIPKPFEVGSIGTIAERTAELMFEKEMTKERFGQRISNMMMQTFAMDPTPQLIKPLLDVYANKDSFTGRAIENPRLEKLRPEDRFDQSTSITARVLGQLGLPNPADLAKGQYTPLSPKQLDFLARGYFGWVGATSLAASDYVLRPAMGEGERPDRKLKDLFVVGSFAEDLPSNTSRYVDQMYQQLKVIQQAHDSLQSAIKSGDLERAQEISKDERANLVRYHKAQQIGKREAEIAAMVRRTQASKTLSAETKRTMLDNFARQQDALAQQLQ